MAPLEGPHVCLPETYRVILEAIFSHLSFLWAVYCRTFIISAISNVIIVGSFRICHNCGHVLAFVIVEATFSQLSIFVGSFSAFVVLVGSFSHFSFV